MRASITVPLVLCLMACAGCDKPECDVTGHKVDTRVVVTHIGTPSRFFEVRMTGFHPGADVNLSILNYPKSPDISASLKLDAAGSSTWTKYAPLLLATDPTYEPDVDVTTTVAERATKCFSIAKTKHREFAKI